MNAMELYEARGRIGRPPLTAAQGAVVVEYRSLGLTYAEIGRLLGMSAREARERARAASGATGGAR